MNEIPPSARLPVEEVASSELVYPPESYLDKCYTFKNVDDEVYTYMQEKFIEIMS